MQITEQVGLEHAYKVLNVAPDASVLAIKQAYRKLVKRWHPDLYAAGTPAHGEATQMSRLLNEAYATISHAPLRYRAGVRTEYTASPSAKDQDIRFRYEELFKFDSDEYPRIDRVEFWVRFVCGGLLGVFIGFGLALQITSNYRHFSDLYAAIGFLAIVAACIFGAVRYGDKFWYGFFGGVGRFRR